MTLISSSFLIIDRPVTVIDTPGFAVDDIEEELEQILNERDPADAPNCPYIIPQSEKLGKLIWITGPPGAGKSTTAQIMGRNHGYVFYSVDCFVFGLVNPFIDLNVGNPTLAQQLQNPLKVSTLHSTVVQIHMSFFCNYRIQNPK